MVVHKRKKKTRQRGSYTHGWGSKKKHRGAGNRGGRGLSGTGKRGDQRKTSFWQKKYFGKSGFKKKGYKKSVNAVNLGYLEEKLEKFLSKKLISKENDYYSINLTKLGYNKLLSAGFVKNKFKITVNEASKKSIEKVKNGGGEVILPTKEVKKE